ncbi:MAG TPA: hypothetical protein VK306_01430 [Acidimicrobiales bacterium]|nr:hypothetical protein [Acidimicrobiales bacterium]
MDETVVRHETEVCRWDGPKAKMTLSGTMLGTLVLTDRHLMFLSTGGNDMGRRMRSATIGGALGGELAATRTGTLDLRALGNAGSFAIPLDHVDEARAASRWDRTKYLALRLRDADEAPFEFAFMGKTGMRDVKGWEQSIETAMGAIRH